MRAPEPPAPAALAPAARAGGESELAFSIAREGDLVPRFRDGGRVRTVARTLAVAP